MGGRKWPKEKSHHNKKELTCLTLNARSIINKIDILQATVYDIQPDIIGITETWANDM